MAYPSIPTLTHMDTIADIGTTTNRRDVSELLDLWAHKSTPFLNRLSWGAESGGLNIEWITEHLGFGYIQPVGERGGEDKRLVRLSGARDDKEQDRQVRRRRAYHTEAGQERDSYSAAGFEGLQEGYPAHRQDRCA